MTNDTPPRACLADFAFTNMVFDQQSLLDSPIPTFEGGTLTFMAPELLAPSRFGLKSAVPTQEGDVYAFGLVILQVLCCAGAICPPFLMPYQVLTGVQPFRDANPLELAYQVSVGVRPEKPADAEAIGLSESLWKLIQKCWDGDKARRPQIQEVVTGVGDFAAAWNRDMPPGGTESREGSISDEDSDEPENGELSLFLTVSFLLILLCSWDVRALPERRRTSCRLDPRCFTIQQCARCLAPTQ